MIGGRQENPLLWPIGGGWVGLGWGSPIRDETAANEAPRLPGRWMRRQASQWHLHIAIIGTGVCGHRPDAALSDHSTSIPTTPTPSAAHIQWLLVGRAHGLRVEYAGWSMAKSGASHYVSSSPPIRFRHKLFWKYTLFKSTLLNGAFMKKTKGKEHPIRICHQRWIYHLSPVKTVDR